MEITIVGFNIHEKRSVVYRTFKTKDAAATAFRGFLDLPDIQFLSIRKINPKEENTD